MVPAAAGREKGGSRDSFMNRQPQNNKPHPLGLKLLQISMW